MNIFKRFILNYKYKKKIFKKIDSTVDYKQFNSKFINPQNISIGKYSKILDYAYIDGKGGIEIGNCVVIAPQCTILTVNHRYDENEIEFLPFDNFNITKKVIIEDYCWIGRNVIIIPGVKIGKASIIAAGSVVTKDVEPYSIVGGNPAKLIKVRDKENVDKLIKDNKCWNNKILNTNCTKIFIKDSNDK